MKNHKRAEFARDQYVKYVKSWNITDSLTGFKARKIDQAYRLFIYNLGIKPNSPSIFGRCEIYKERRRRSERKENAIRNQKRQLS